MGPLQALVSVLLFSVPYDASNDAYYVDVALDGPGVLPALVEAGRDMGGVNLERGTASVIIRGRDLVELVPFRTRSLRRVDAVPDAQYKTPSEVEQILKDTERAYPMIARVESIGTSVEGREIYAIELTNKFTAPIDKKTILIDSMHHAREVMSPEVAIDMIDYLTKNYATDPKVQDWVNNNRIWVVPMVNPDGNNRVWNQESMWRKNTRNQHGVDNNRNYPYDWATCNGSSGSTGSETYRGPAPGSEPETTALMDLARRIKPTMAISYHSYSEIVIYPFGCRPKHVPQLHRETYERVGRELAKKLVRDSGNGTYEAGTSYELLYNVDGGSIDWLYNELRTMAYVVEVNSTSQGFQPSYQTWRNRTVTAQRAGWQYLLDRLSDTQLP